MQRVDDFDAVAWARGRLRWESRLAQLTGAGGSSRPPVADVVPLGRRPAPVAWSATRAAS